MTGHKHRKEELETEMKILSSEQWNWDEENAEYYDTYHYHTMDTRSL
jgi:hypothetical protein